MTRQDSGARNGSTIGAVNLDRIQLARPGDDRPRPHPNCYWLLPGLVLAGEYPRTDDERQSREKLSRIISCGVREFIDLTEATEPLAPYAAMAAEVAADAGADMNHARRAIRDLSIPTPQLMRSILDDIYVAVAWQRPVYLHCWGGIGRTGTVAGCLLVEAGFTGQEALDLLAAKWKAVEKSGRRPHSPETREQVEFIHAWSAIRGPVSNARSVSKEIV